MSVFDLILEKRYEEYCKLYLEKGHLQKTVPEFASLLEGNYMTALLGLKEYDTYISICQKSIAERRKESMKYDMSVSHDFIGLSIGCLKQQRFEAAAQAIREGTKAAYQDIARTQAPCIMYYEAVVTANESLKRESKRILAARLRTKGAASVEFAAARFLMGKRSAKDLIWEINEISNSIIRYRRMVAALFYIAVKQYEDGDKEGCRQYLQAACDLYGESHVVAMEVEYYLAEDWLSELHACDEAPAKE